MRRSIRILLPALALIAAAPAQAATPFTAGTGTAPTVAVGSDGTGHVVWETAVPGENQVGYCRVPPGGSACDRTATFDFPSSEGPHRGSNRALVFAPAAQKVVIVAGCRSCGTNPSNQFANKVFRWISTDNGASFGLPLQMGEGPETDGFGAWIEESQIFVAASHSHVKAFPVGTAGLGVDYSPGELFSYAPEVARVGATNELVAADNDLDEVTYAVFEGAPLTVTNINDPSKWKIALHLDSPEPDDNSDTALNSGPNGVFLTYQHFIANDSQVGLRRYDPATNKFGPPVYIEGGDAIENVGLEEPDSFQDPAGRIHVVWRTRYQGNRLRYTVSDTGGGGFSVPATLARSEEFTGPEVAAGTDGRGFATWAHSVIRGAIRVVPLEPEAEGAAAPDTTPPAIGGFKISSKTLKPGQKASFRFRSSEAGTAVLTLEKRFKGIRGKRKGKKGKRRTTCIAVSRKRLRALRRKGKKIKRCRGFRRIGQIRQRVEPGLNTIVFGGRIAGRKLKPGQYRAKLVVTDQAGQVSRTETLRFRVVKPTKRKRRGRR